MDVYEHLPSSITMSAEAALSSSPGPSARSNLQSPTSSNFALGTRAIILRTRANMLCTRTYGTRTHAHEPGFLPLIFTHTASQPSCLRKPRRAERTGNSKLKLNRSIVSRKRNLRLQARSGSG